MNKDPKLIIHTTNPINAEPPLEELRENFITPLPLYYMRNHGEIPVIDVNTYRLQIHGMVEHTLEFSMENITKDFKKHTVMATLQCAGNRRTQLIEFAPIPGEVAWLEGAIGNATWSGVKLKEILNIAGIKADAKYVAFMGADTVFRQGKNVGFGASVPIDKAMNDDVLLAYEMNGKTLEPAHGFPLRVVVPGYIGARSVKWVTEIILQPEPSKNYFQDHAYKLFPPEAKPETVDWNTGLQLGELGVNCVITFPQNGNKISNKNITVKGYAMSGEGRKITYIDISTDGGKNWIPAIITEGDHKWAWTFWELNLHLETGQHQIIARAFDSDKNAQPQKVQSVWNFKGYMNNAWHTVKFEVKDLPD